MKAAWIKGFGGYVPKRVVGNAEIAPLVGSDAEWIRNVSGIEERRFADEDEAVAAMASAAAQVCLESTGVPARQIELVILSCASGERRFPGPAAAVAHRLGLTNVPALDLPVASAGSIFGLTLAANLTARFRHILVLGAEKMSSIALQPPLDRSTSVLFGDGAGACLISAEEGWLKIHDALIESDGAFADDLYANLDGPLKMNGRSVILQASRKIPRAIETLLSRNGFVSQQVEVFLMHQANQNLLDRIARALGVPEERFYTNIRQYGNTSSASLLLAASEWADSAKPEAGAPIVMAAFGAGFHWGALLASAAEPKA